jgi:hypothetical protein
MQILAMKELWTFSSNMLSRFMAHCGEPSLKGAWLWYYSNHCLKPMNINNIIIVAKINED